MQIDGSRKKYVIKKLSEKVCHLGQKELNSFDFSFEQLIEFQMHYLTQLFGLSRKPNDEISILEKEIIKNFSHNKKQKRNADNQNSSRQAESSFLSSQSPSKKSLQSFRSSDNETDIELKSQSKSASIFNKDLNNLI